MTYSKHARELFSGIDTISIEGDFETRVNGIEYDSRSVFEGCLFAALPGVHTDGTRFVEQAIKLGARAILSEKRIPNVEPGVLYVQVRNVRSALSAISSAFYDHPAKKLLVIGVTGTDGKSTTVWLIHQLLEALEYRSGFLSTVELKEDDTIIKNPYRQSTPEASQMHRILAGMADSGKELAVIEATSHGLSKKTSRLQDVLFDVAVLTNITHEHFEFHGSFEQYRSDKTELFRSLSHVSEKKLADRIAHAQRPFGVANLNDQSSEYVIGQTKARVLTYGIDNPKADLNAIDIDSQESGTSFTIVSEGQTVRASLPLPGIFNVENILASCLTLKELLGISLTELSLLFPQLKSARGRMKDIICGQPFRVIVDYGHTPAAFKKVFTMLRPLVKERIIAVFGSAGERDVTKRPMQGKVASEYCDIIVLTDEDPRLEDRGKIIEDILAGCEHHTLGKNVFIVPSRKQAIRLAFEIARAGDTVILLGKGHETSIIYPDGPIKWDEIEVARTTLVEMGYTDNK